MNGNFAAQGDYGRQNLGSQQGSTQPKEIGLLDRVAGVRGGLGEIRERLGAFADRVNGGASTKGAEQPAPPHGLPSNISEAEGYIRDILTIVATLEQAF